MPDDLKNKRLSLSLRLILLLVLCGFSFVQWGCAVSKLDASAWQDPQLGMVWPRAPEKARIKLLRIIGEPGDVIGAEKSSVGKFFDFVLGTNEERAGFFTPQCIAADGNGLIFIADPSLGAVHRYDLASKDVSYIVQAGTTGLGSPVGVALDKEDNLYVTDSLNAAVYKFNSQGTLIGELDGKGRFRRPTGIVLTSKGDKVIADTKANTVFLFDKDDVLKGELSGKEFNSFNMPTYVAVDGADRVYVTDSLNFTVRVFDADGKYLRSIGQVGDSPGSFARPKGIALDSDGNLYVLDAIFGVFQIFNPEGRLLLYVGQEGGLPGEMLLPSGIFIDREDRIYVSDTFNHRIQVFQYLKEKRRQ